MKKIIELCTKNSFKLGLGLSYSKGATYKGVLLLILGQEALDLKWGCDL